MHIEWEVSLFSSQIWWGWGEAKNGFQYKGQCI